MRNTRQRMSGERTYRYERLNVRAGGGSRATMWRTLLIVCAVAAAAGAYVWLQSGGEKNNRLLQTKRRDYALNTKNLENLRMELESYRSGNYILSEINRRGLALQPPRPGQVRRVSIGSPDHDFNSPERALVAQY